jgi:SMC interacting uncharacterized protein involved in chromosome segregation
MIQQPVYSAEEEEEENADKAFFEYLGTAYHVFLAGDDNQYNLLEKEEAAKLGACIFLAGVNIRRADSRHPCLFRAEEQNRLIAEQSMELERQQMELKQRIQKGKETKVPPSEAP